MTTSLIVTVTLSLFVREVQIYSDNLCELTLKLLIFQRVMIASRWKQPIRRRENIEVQYIHAFEYNNTSCRKNVVFYCPKTRSYFPQVQPYLPIFLLALSLFYRTVLPFIKWPSQSFLHTQGHKNLIQLTLSHPCDSFFT